MLDEKDLQAIADLMEQKINESEVRTRKAVKESQGQLIAFIESDVYPRIALVGEGHDLTQQMLKETNRKLDEFSAKLDMHDVELHLLRKAK